MTVNSGQAPVKAGNKEDIYVSIHAKMVHDFICSADTQFGYGCFRGIAEASQLAQSLSKNAMRGFERYQIVPPLFFQCLRQIRLIDSEIEMPSQGVNLHHAEKILKAAGLRNRQFWNDFFKDGLHLKSCSQQYLWKKLEIMKRQPRRLNLYNGRG
jgi:hypothetical protein